MVVVVAAFLSIFALFPSPASAGAFRLSNSEHVQRFNREYNSTANLEDARNTFVNAFKIVLLFEGWEWVVDPIAWASEGYDADPRREMLSSN